MYINSCITIQINSDITGDMEKKARQRNNRRPVIFQFDLADELRDLVTTQFIAKNLPKEIERFKSYGTQKQRYRERYEKPNSE